ncbi:MAG: Arginine N-methyltransferase 2, partial [Pleopsidium flavum]
MFDAIYFDTFAEDYKALRDFLSEYVIGLLQEGGKWGFFNGLGADRQVCYDVYGKVVEMDLFEAGFDTEWETLDVPDLEKSEEWKG